MKKYSAIIPLCATIIFACNSTKKKDPEPVAPVVVSPSAATTDQGKACYQKVTGKDSVVLSFTVTDNIVTGNLVYNYFEKDKNSGTIRGRFMGDTLLADYTFRAEGTESVREVVFLRSGNTLTEGFGDSEDKNGKLVFKNLKQIKFSPADFLERGDCAEDRGTHVP